MVLKPRCEPDVSWDELFVESSRQILDLELLCMMMIVKGRQVTGFICCVFCVCLNVLNRHMHT